MALDTAISLTDVDNVKSHIGKAPEKDGIWIYWSSGDADAATVEVTDTTFVLKVTVGTAHRAVTTNVATIGTDAAHGLVVGSSVVISGMADAAYDGTHTVTVVPDTTHFSFALVHADEVETVDTGGTVIGTNTLTFADADKDTIAELIIAINALTGWTSGAIYNGLADSSDLIVTGALGCLGVANEQTLKIADDYFLAELINMASDFLNRYCHRTLKSTAYTLERFNGDGNKLFLPNYPVTLIAQVCEGKQNAIRVQYTSTTAYNAYVQVDAAANEQILLIADGVADATIDTSSGNDDLLSEVVTAINAVASWTAQIANTDFNSWPSAQLFERQNRYCLNRNAYLEVPEIPLDDYDVDYDNGIIELTSGFWRDFQNIFVSYTAGYSTIPASLAYVCKELVKLKHDQRDIDLNLKSEKIGSVYSYTIADLKEALTPSQMATLDLFVSSLL